MIFFDIIFLLSVPDICGLRLFGCEVAVDILLMTFSVDVSVSTKCALCIAIETILNRLRQARQPFQGKGQRAEQ